MSYVKWVANRNRHTDWTTHLILRDGTEVFMGKPVDLNAETRKTLEAQGRIFEDSSAEEAKEAAEAPDAQQPVGADVAGTAPLFQNNPRSQAEQTDQTDQGADARKR